MRFLIALILVFFLHFSASHAMKNEKRTMHKTSAKSRFISSHQVTCSLKTEKQALNEELFSVTPDRIHQPIHQYQISSTIIGVMLLDYAVSFSPIKPIRISKEGERHSDLFTFSCLYPKHNFW